MKSMDHNIPPHDFDDPGLGVHYCPGYIDKNNTWKNGFYCPPQTKKIYCCGTPFHKYCCTEKELNNGKYGVPSFVSSSTLITVVVITFFLAVFVTIFMFIVCKKYWKRGVEIRETHLYRMSSSMSANNGNTMASLDPSTLVPNANNSRYALVPSNAYETYHPMNHGNERNRITILEPPPPYHISTGNRNHTGSGNSSNNARLFSVLTTPCRRDTVFPCDGRKRLWRTLSQ